MENQVSFFIIDKLYNIVTGIHGSREFLLNIIVDAYSRPRGPIRRPSDDWQVHHIPHLYYECFMPKQDGLGMPARSLETMVKLSEARVTFIRRSAVEDRYVVKFDCLRGVIELPSIRSLVTNLIAFKQTHGVLTEPPLLTGYVALMSQLVATTRDIELLRRHSILQSLVANEEETTEFFSRLDEGGIMELTGPNGHPTFAGLYEDINQYNNSHRHRYRAALRRGYFASPWIAISIAATTFVLLLTITQTYFTIFPRKKNSR
uniref:Uncharacterized protein n=1 Tax=Leersia perrieri TaxID=77586 RepID=A0A0D9VQA4_9ORYZ